MWRPARKAADLSLDSQPTDGSNFQGRAVLVDEDRNLGAPDRLA